MGRSISRRPQAGMVFGATFDHGDARDHSSIGATITSIGTPTTALHLALNGSADQVHAPDNDAYSFGDGSSDSPFSVFAWVRMADATRFRLVQKWGGTTALREWGFGTDGANDLRLFLQDDSAGRIDKWTATALTAQEGSWISVAATYSGSGTVAGMDLYVDGVAVSTVNSTTGSYTAMENDSARLDIGSLTPDSTFANGDIDSLQIFDRKLAATGVAILHQQGRR